MGPPEKAFAVLGEVFGREVVIGQHALQIGEILFAAHGAAAVFGERPSPREGRSRSLGAQNQDPIASRS